MMSDSRLPRRRISILVAIGSLALLAAAYAGVRVERAGAARFHGTPYPDAPSAPDFSLIDHRGASANLADWSGGPVLLFFGFADCPDVCPITLSTLSRVLAEEEIGPEEVRVLLITVDPENDSPERLADYVTRFGPNVTGLTGESAEIERVLAEYGVYARRTTGHAGHETIAHTTVVFGIDRSGRLQVLMHPEEGDEVIRDDIEALLRIGS